MKINYKTELEELKKIYELTQKELNPHYEKRLSGLIYEMHKFLELHKTKIECDSKLNSLNAKLKCEDHLKKEDNFDLSGSCGSCCDEDEDDDE
jgi:hypothetical protein